MPFLAPSGRLIVHGGGTTSEETARAFIERAGGPDAPLVILAQSNADPAAKAELTTGLLRRAGARNIYASPITKPDDPALADLARRIRSEAAGVWMPGGDQNRFMSVFVRSDVPRAVRALLERGGVAGGSSAGASLQGEWMPTGDGDRTLLARSGGPEIAPALNLLPGVLFDTHFLKRERTQRLVGMILSRPGLLGIGVDENGWIEVDTARGGRLTVRAGQVMVMRAVGPVRAGSGSGSLSCPDIRMNLLATGESASLEEQGRRK